MLNSNIKHFRLRVALNMKGEHFVKKMHVDSMELLRMMIDTEKWQRICVSLDDQGGIFGLIEKRSGYTFPWQNHISKSSIFSAPPSKLKNKNPILPKFLVDGNPFSLKKRSVWTSNKSMERYTFESNNNFDEEDEQIKRMLKLDPYLIDGIHHEPSPQQEEIIRYGSKYVVTSASLSGFVR